jgi:CBS domain-containing protein/rhodanese-related sulfurtransferase
LVERVDTDAVRELINRGAALIEVLPKSAYDTEHLPGALSIPLGKLTGEAVACLDAKRPTITYCYDYQCDLSARAAHRLETLGFARVYDYAASKVAWLAAGLPAEGRIAENRRAGGVARTDVPTCDLDATVTDVAAIIDGHERVVVTDDDGVVLGIVRRDILGLPDKTWVEAVMQPAPPTVRPSITVDELADSMENDGRSYVLVTHFDGTLVGLIERSDLYGRH